MPTSKEIQLKKHKTFATGLFLVMVAIYIIMIYLRKHSSASWIGYVHSFSEAAMVGALADWFAVTALFRYPLGLKIPHTNLIENKKKDIGENLGSFVKDNFLTSDNIRPYIEKLDVVTWISKWLNEGKNQTILSKEISALVRKILHDLDDSEVVNFLSRKFTEALLDIDFNQMGSKGIQYIIDNGEHIKLLDNLLPQIKEYAQNSQDVIRKRVNKQRPFIGFLAGKKISKEFTQGIVDFIEEVDTDKHHWLREKITDELEKIKNRITSDPKWAENINALKSKFIVQDRLAPYVNDAWESIKTTTVEGLEDPNSALMIYLNRNIAKVSNDLQQDTTLQTRINSWVRKFVFTTVLRNRDQVEKVIESTVSQWRGRELSEKLELEIGKDLQFIRVNGTIVGGLVGLLIYTITELLF